MVFALAAMACLAGCGEDPTPRLALDVQLVPDLNLNGVRQISGAIDTVRVVIDSPQGLYKPGSEFAKGNVEVRDVDSDPTDLELVATVSNPFGRLPLVRIERGGLPNVALDIRAIGYLASSPSVRVAEGIVRGIRFDFEGVKNVPVPFNLRPEFLPPRVTEVQPADGASVQYCRVETIVVVFSKPIDPRTLLAPGNFTHDRDPSPASIVLDPSGYIATYTAGNPRLDERQSYRITISTEVKSRDGAGLDQVAAEPGAQPFDTRFTMECSIGTAVVPDPCSPMSGPSGHCPGHGRFACVEGACVPAQCQQNSCLAPLVCDPVSLRCDVDCRVYGDVEVCPEDRPVCEAGTGVCIQGP